MTRLLLVVLLTGCGCAQQPLVPQATLDNLARQYAQAKAVTDAYAAWCPLADVTCNTVYERAQRANYSAAAALLAADSERTPAAVQRAANAVRVFTQATEGME